MKNNYKVSVKKRTFTSLDCLYILIFFTLFISCTLITAKSVYAFSSPVGYNEHDYQKLVAFLEENYQGTKNGFLINASYDPEDPSTWLGVEWTLGEDKKIRTINWPSLGIGGPLDLSNLTNLTHLKIDCCNLSALKLSGCIDLEEVDCTMNPLLELDLDACPSLKILQCGYGRGITSCALEASSEAEMLLNNLPVLRELDLSSCSNLRTVACVSSFLYRLKVSNLLFLEELYCGDAVLKELELENCPSLRRLEIVGTKSETYDLSTCPNLTRFVWTYGQGEYMDFSACPALEEVIVDYNTLRTINLTNCSNLKELHCFDNRLKQLDLSDCINLEALYCSMNDLEELSLIGLDKLEDLTCHTCFLRELNLKDCSALMYLEASFNLLETVCLKGCSGLVDLYVERNLLPSLDLEDCLKLENLECQNNLLTDLNLSDCPALRNLICRDNFLEKLDLAANSNIEWIFCDNNYIDHIIMPSECNKLSTFFCGNNNLSFSSLPQLTLSSSDYKYEGQKELKLANWPFITDQDTVDLSAEAEIAGVSSLFKWFDDKGSEITPIEVGVGEFKFANLDNRSLVYCEITNSKFPYLNPLKTVNLLFLEQVNEPELIFDLEDVIVRIGGEANFSLLALNPPGYEFSYQWQSSPDGQNDWQDIPSAKEKEYLIKDVPFSLSGSYYRCQLTANKTFDFDPIYSKAAELTVISDPSLVKDLEDIAILDGDSATFTLIAQGDNELHYNWQYHDGYDWYPIEWGENQDEITLDKEFYNSLNIYENAELKIQCHFVNILDGLESNVLATREAILTIVAEAGTIGGLDDLILAEGASASLILVAAPSRWSELVCLWELSSDSGVTWQEIQGEENPELLLNEVSFSQNHNLYRAKVASAKGNVISDFVDVGTAEIFVVARPKILEELSPQVVLKGERASFRIVAEVADADEGGLLSYQWQTKLKGGWQDIPLANGATYELDGADYENHNQGLYRCLLKNTKLNTWVQVTSGEALLTVLDIPQIILEPKDTTAALNSTQEFNSQAQPSLGAEIGYQWVVSEDGGDNWQEIPQANDRTLVLDNLRKDMDNNLYRVKVWSYLDEVQSPEVLSQQASLYLVEDPEIIEQTVNVKSLVSREASFKVVLKEIDEGKGTLSYQWQKLLDGEWSDLAGATNSIYTIEEVREEDDNSLLRCKILNIRNTVPSNVVLSKEVSLEVLPMPIITKEPSDLTLANGGEGIFTLEVNAKDDFTLAYQWQEKINDEWKDREGDINRELTLSNVDYSLEGNLYQCLIRVSYEDEVLETLTSKAARLMIVVDPEFIDNPSHIKVALGAQGSFSVTVKELEAGAGVISYQWQKLVGREWSNLENATSSSYTIAAVTLEDHHSQYRCQVLNTRNEVPSNLTTSKSASLEVDLELEVSILRPLADSSEENPLNINTGSLVIIELSGNLENIDSLTMWLNDGDELELNPANKVYYLLGSNLEPGENTISVKLLDLLGGEKTASVSFYWEAYRKGFGFGRLGYDD